MLCYTVLHCGLVTEPMLCHDWVAEGSDGS